MATAEAVNRLVFRETRERVSTPALVSELLRVLQRIKNSRPDGRILLDALIRAGELECGLSDAGSAAAEHFAGLTDSLSKLLLQPHQGGDVRSRVAELKASPLPETIVVSPPEGFAYYALHPLHFANLAAQLDFSGPAAIVGIRSIGPVLSAAVKAALERRGKAATRITVRPGGHPYDRVNEFNPDQKRWVDEQKKRGSTFLVVDEGPGLSGSSFLSVGEALVHQGIPSEQIVLVGTRKPEGLCTRDADARTRKFQWETVKGDFYSGFGGYASFGGGVWRAFCFESATEWPASWTQMERLKFLSSDRRRLLKFEGFGRFGERANQRAMQVAEAGFGPAVETPGDGLLAYTFINGKPLRARDVSSQILERIARYCAFRGREFRVNAPQGPIAEMARFNCIQEFGVAPELPEETWEVSSPVIVDGRMQPNEWIASQSGEFLKVDAVGHGDDHFFPGPTDVAWDLAGTIVEWGLDQDATEWFVSRYTHFSGDNPRARMVGFLLAYGIFRMSYCRMAASAVQDSEECNRLQSAYEYYRARVSRNMARLDTLQATPISSREIGVRISGGSSA